jgi:ACR3 family arsenite efflux pump ArsB
MDGVRKQLSSIDRYLTFLILLTMSAGVLLGYQFPSIAGFWDTFKSGTTNIRIVSGAMIMEMHGGDFAPTFSSCQEPISAKSL